MDPISQGILGAALPQAASRKKSVVAAGLAGFGAGLLPDADVFIRSSTDPLLALEYHRQFTHSIFFIPFGGLIAAAIVHLVLWRWWRLPFRRTLIYCTLGYATHGLLDFATSYGTMLFWPFSDVRLSASIISIIDPLFTVPIVVLVGSAMAWKSPGLGRLACAWAIFYLSLGTLQHFNARAMAADLAAGRGHAPEDITVKPSIGNILVWKTIYTAGDRYYVDAVRAGIAPRIYPGTSIAKLDTRRDFPWLDPESQQYRDVNRFAWFSQGYVALDPKVPNTVIDVRYSFLPNTVDPLWSVEVSPAAGPGDHVKWDGEREDGRPRVGEMWRMIVGG